jgi:hypothetical protein
MKLHEILSEMPAFTKSDIGFGLNQYENGNYVLSGGFRSGNSSDGMTRLRYDIYSMDLFNSTNDPAKSKIGIVDLLINDSTGDIHGLVNIELLPAHRKSGHGMKIVSDIKDTAQSDITIYDIQKKAKRFWDKAGVVYDNRSGTQGKIKKG